MHDMTDTGGHPAKIPILVLDEQPMLRCGISAYLNSQPDMVVCGEADNIAVAASKIAEYQPQLLVTDLRLNAANGLRFLNELKAKNRAVRVLVYSALDETIFAERAMRAGADGYLMKTAPGEELTAAIRNIVSGGIYVSSEAALVAFRKSLQQWRKKDRPSRSPNALEHLSDREMHIFQLLGSGLRPRDIAQSLDLSVKTVEAHRENIKHKLQLGSSAELREYAVEWAEETSGVRKSGKLGIEGSWEGKPSRPRESEELHRRIDEEAPIAPIEPIEPATPSHVHIPDSLAPCA
ncbi:MAG TPA: response regulator transcription factor [Candidatus Udaeobacter sp.]|jgi:DNA-binding NarL/FixJ family response regulator